MSDNIQRNFSNDFCSIIKLSIICLYAENVPNSHIITKIWLNFISISVLSPHKQRLTCKQVHSMVCRCHSVCHLVLIETHFNFPDLRPHIKLTLYTVGLYFCEPCISPQIAVKCALLSASGACQAHLWYFCGLAHLWRTLTWSGIIKNILSYIIGGDVRGCDSHSQ